ncbi:MAG: 4-(cytidine 5'-diphospho)-2-C-methyl-D-erythritol kinase [Proteobacteria bacterium]|jgi:4-diphosphocytidyl-2-C-methyl-D-erythritol kinase|nr:4-(cytidine 5'-diphospho)-2-C-methyl-D-erythritol kinase [Pseudomonadota bacterium]MDA0941956.1 4-(cytidine 5'-diphospho)-2-C-methyl-D-erythritol kinase [Pseudomonadota bacterium]MDA1034699.1 4-(cytidine 5'-diphospho)-2-C-methyl-D-erythritol kinase [Pseudomonadota bacterium]
MAYVKFKSPAKLNLFLNVVGRKPDGYHNLQSIFTFVDLHDELFFQIEKNGLRKITVNNPTVHTSFFDDLIYKACEHILPKEYSIDIKVNKIIPQGGGLGGGSSNAATTLIAINQLCQLNMSQKQLADVGVSLGADIPFFIHNKNAFVEGVGEKITPINLKPMQFLICYPCVNISTKEIFGAFKLTNKSKELKITALSNYDEIINTQGNDLEDYILDKNIKIKQLLNYLRRFGNAKITGTGSSCFLILKENIDVEAVIKELPTDTVFFKSRSLDHNVAYNSSL